MVLAKWVCTSTAPGTTIRPCAGISRRVVCGRPGATAAMVPSLTPMSVTAVESAVTTLPPRTMRSNCTSLPTGQGPPYGSYVTAWRMLHCVPEELVVAGNEPGAEPFLLFEQPLDGHDGAWPILAEHGSPRWLAVGEVLSKIGCVGCEEPRPGVREVDAVGHVPGGMAAGCQHPYAGGDLGVAGEFAPLHWEVG